MKKTILFAAVVVIAAGVIGCYFAFSQQLSTYVGQPNPILQKKPFPYEVSLTVDNPRPYFGQSVTVTPVFTPSLPASFKYQGFAATWVFSSYSEYPDRHAYDKDITNPQTITYNDCYYANYPRGVEPCIYTVRYRLYLPGYSEPFLERTLDITAYQQE